MGGGAGTLVTIAGVYLAIRLWTLFVNLRVVRLLPAAGETLAALAEDDVAPETRAALLEAAAPVRALGFEPLGYLRVSEPLIATPRTVIAFVHPVDHTFALIGFDLVAGDFGVAADLVSFFEDGTWCATVNGRSHQWALPMPARADAFVATFAELQRAHGETRARLARGREAVALSLPALAARVTETEREMLQAGVASGHLTPTADPRLFQRTARGAQERVSRFAAGAKRAKEAPLLSADFRAARLPAETQETYYQASVLGRDVRRRAVSAWLVLALTAAGFAASMAFSTSWTWVAWILPAVLFHELGHWVAMRAFGHDDARIAFVPLLGAYTMSHKPFQKRWQEVVMLLAGPLPGLFLGLVLSAVAASRGWTQVSSACLVMIGLNALNLLPIHPLDGGRVLHLLVTSGRPRVDFAVRILGAAVLLGAAFKAGDWVLVFFAATLLLTLQRGRRRPALESRIRAMPGFAPGMPPAQRRPLVFAALADTPRRSLTAWFEDVVALEAQTAYARPTVGNVLGSCAVLAIGVGGLTVLSVGATLFMTRRPRCPSEAQTVALRCDRAFEPTAVAWQPGAPRAGTTFRFGALVTCRGGRGADAFERMNTAQHAAPFCTSLPWEESAPPDETTRQARRTLARILPAGPHEGAERESERQFLNFVVEHEGEEGRLDPETIRLTRAFLEPNQASSAEAQSLLAARLGRSPDQSCRKLQIVQTAFDVEAGTAGGAPAARYGVAFETPEDFAPLASYLCAQGCELRVAPVAPNDPVLSSCR